MPSLHSKHRPPTQGKQALHVQEANKLRSATYDGVWRRLRRQHLAREPLCRHCLAKGRLTEAQHVDHVTPVKDAPDRRLDASNLQSLCRSCHSKKTAAENYRGSL